MTNPEIPAAAYGDELLAQLVVVLTAVLPYAAAVTAFVIGLVAVKRWLGDEVGEEPCWPGRERTLRDRKGRHIREEYDGDDL